MELTVTNIKEFKKAITTACLAVEKKNTMPVLSHVRISHEDNRSYLISTDIETSIKIDISNMVVDPKPGAALVPGTMLKEYASKVKQPFKIETINNDWTNIGAMRVASLSPDEFPVWPKLGKSDSGTILNLSDKVKSVLSSAGESDTRYTLNSLYFDFANSRISGTDGHRLAVTTMSCNPFEPRIVPRNTAKVLQKIKGDVSVQSGEKHVLFQYDGLSVLSRVIEGTFPNVDNVVPKKFNSVCVADRELLKETISAVAMISKSRSGVIVLYCRENEGGSELVISASSPDVGEMEQTMPCVWDKFGEIYAGFNSKYILNALTTFSGTEVAICCTDSLSPFKLIDPENPELLHIIMPMRADNDKCIWVHSKYPESVPEEIRAANIAKIAEARIARKLAKANKRPDIDWQKDYRIAA